MSLLRKTLSAGLLVLASLACAHPDDSKRTMQISADTSRLNYKTGENIYEGAVRINQGTSHLSADRLITRNNEHHKLQEAIAYGTYNLAHYWTIPKDGDKLLNAYAKIIKFYPLESKVVLEGNVIVKQGENSFHGPIIIYNIKNQTVSAPPNQKGRATIIIEPQALT